MDNFVPTLQRADRRGAESQDGHSHGDHGNDNNGGQINFAHRTGLKSRYLRGFENLGGFRIRFTFQVGSVIFCFCNYLGLYAEEISLKAAYKWPLRWEKSETLTEEDIVAITEDLLDQLIADYTKP